MRRRGGSHVSDEALLALLEPDTDRVADRTREHVALCVACGERLERLERVQTLLRESAAREYRPERDLASGALRRLQRRGTAIANVNEFFGVLFAIVRGLGTLLTVEESESRAKRAQAKRTGDTHG